MGTEIEWAPTFERQINLVRENRQMMGALDVPTTGLGAKELTQFRSQTWVSSKFNI